MASEKIIIEVSETGARIVKKNIEDIGHGAEQAHSAVDQLKHALALIGVGFAIHEAIKDTAAFEQAISKLQATTGLTGSAMERLRNEAAEFGATTRFSATEAAGALNELADSGLSVTQALDAMPHVIDLALTGSISLGESANVTAAALQKFRLSGDEAAKVVDVLATVSLKSRTSVGGFGDALRVTGSAAVLAKAPFVEVAAAIATLTEKGEGGSRAGLALKKVITELQNPSVQMVKTLRLLGINAEDVKISNVGLTKAIQTLSRANLDGATVMQLFGDRAAPVAGILLESADRAAEMAQKFREGGVVAKDTAKILDTNLNGSLLRLKSSVEAVVLEFANLGASKLLRFFIDSISGAFLLLAHNVELLGGAIVGLAVVKLPALVSGLKQLFALVGGTNPMLLLALSIGVAVGALVKFRDQIKVTADGTVSLGDIGRVTADKIKVAFEGLGDVIVKSLSSVSPVLGNIFEKATVSFQGIANFAALAFDSVLGVAQGTFSAMIVVFEAAPDAIGEIMYRVVNKVIGGLNALLRVVQLNLNEVITKANEISANLGAALDIRPVALAQFSDLKSPFEGASQQLGDATRLAFEKGFMSSNLVSDFVDGIFANARSEADKLKTELGAGGDAGGAAPGGTGTLGGGAVGASDADRKREAALKSVNEQLNIEFVLAEKMGSARALYSAQMAAENQLKAAGLDLDDKRNASVVEEIKNKVSLIETERLKTQVLEEIKGPQEEGILRQTALNELLAQGAITTEEFTLATQELYVSLVQNNDAMGGFTSTLVKANLTSKQIGETIGTFVVGAIDRASGALAEFALSGFRNVEDLRKAFADLFRDLAKQIIQLIIKILILKAIKAGLGGLGVDTGDVGASAEGGNIVGGQPRLVGERGPEIFTPSTAGNITPNNRIDQRLNQQQAPAAPPEVKVNIVNVKDPKEVTSAMGSSDGEKVILNVLSKNRDSLRRLLNQ